jgi:hypothetical protein
MANNGQGEPTMTQQNGGQPWYMRLVFGGFVLALFVICYWLQEIANSLRMIASHP